MNCAPVEGIGHRYSQIKTTLAKWREADNQFRWAALNNFATGPVVEHIRKDFFANELVSSLCLPMIIDMSSPSVTEHDIEDRYCRKFLGINGHSSSIRIHNTHSDAELQRYALAGGIENHANKSELKALLTAGALSQRRKTTVDPSPFPQQTSIHTDDPTTNATADQQPPSLNYSCSLKRSTVNTHKRVRPDSLTSGRSVHVSPRKNSQPTKETELRKQLKDLGFDAGDVSASNLRSLPSRLKRCSVGRHLSDSP